MRRFILSICILVSSVLFAAAAPDHDYVVKFEQIPAVSQTFVTTHFAKVQVSYCMRDSHSFEVRLADASEIEFNLDGTWKEVDCKYKEIPASVSVLYVVTEKCTRFSLKSVPLERRIKGNKSLLFLS